MLLKKSLRSLAAPSDAEGGFEDIGRDFRETHACGAFFAPASRDWREDFRSVLDHAGLLVAGEQEDSEALVFKGEGCEDFAGNAEIGVAEMRAFRGLG